MKDLGDLLGEVMKSYPEFSRENSIINISYEKSDGSFTTYLFDTTSDGKYVIDLGLDPSLRDKSDAIKSSAIASLLSQAVYDRKVESEWSMIGVSYIGLLEYVIPGLAGKRGKKADADAIKRGYGAGLLEMSGLLEDDEEYTDSLNRDEILKIIDKLRG
jgi:hypothetical protein